jgi:hypothetical protein
LANVNKKLDKLEKSFNDYLAFANWNWDVNLQCCFT